MKYLRKFESIRYSKKLCNFTEDQFEIVNDMFQIYVDKWNMILADNDNFINFDDSVEYNINSYMNIFIEIRCRGSLIDIYDDIRDDFDRRLRFHGFYLHRNDNEYLYDNTIRVYKISFVIMKINSQD